MARAARPAGDGEPTLAAGAVVRAHLVARLLGVRLLRVEATIVIAPPPGGAQSPHPLVPLSRSVVPGVVLAPDGGLPEAERLLRLARSELSERR